MKPPPEKPTSGKEAPATKPTRSEEIRRVIEKYAAGLREIIKKLRRKLHYCRRRIERDHSPVRVMERNAEPLTSWVSPPSHRHPSVTGSFALPPDRSGDALHMIKGPTPAQCREFADHHKARARDPGISQKRATLFANIARSFSGLASQLEMLADDIAQKPGK